MEDGDERCLGRPPQPDAQWRLGPLLPAARGPAPPGKLTHRLCALPELVQLTSIQYRVLEELMRHAGQVLSHQYLLERVWGPAYSRETHYLKGIVRRLRQKLGDDADTPHYIQTVWGDGYRFLPPH